MSLSPTIRDRMVERVYAAQDTICAALAAEDRTAFREDVWERPGGGGGRSRVISEGNVFEKAGVNVSVVHGSLSESAAAAMRSQHDVVERRFFATGLSLVLHPLNPFVPTVHANYRYFELGDPSAPAAWWFGGGADLTPAYLFEEDATHFHQTHKQVCDRHDPALYPRFKAWCDEYFTIPHRGERRGVGGIFFDNLRDRPPEQLFALTSELMGAFLPAWLPILRRRKATPFDEHHRRWQQIRRGRYVEFNLLYDRGTTFGLRTDARVDSVLMSMPLIARWEADFEPAPGSREAETVAVLREPREWVVG